MIALPATSTLLYLLSEGIEIPHFCFHPKLSVSGNCRICLIEVETSVKPVVSCANSLDNIKNKIYYDSPLVQKSRENILEFLLLNHPLDCPICDQGGDCDLQDQSLFFGFSKRRFYKFKRIVYNKDLGPIVKSVFTRCIHCTRCVRFLNEITNSQELGLFGRGSSSQISNNRILITELSGNIIDLCPVGIMTIKIYFRGFNS